MKFNKKIFGVTLFVFIMTLLCFIFDYFNIPTKLGLNVGMINYDLWGILLGNGVVIVLFVITYNLFDKRNLEKEKLADYAAAVLISDTYKQCRTFLPILEGLLEASEEDKKKHSQKMIEYITVTPFKNDDKIFEMLTNGYIARKRYEGYIAIKNTYESLVYHLLSINGFPKIENTLYKELIKELDNEQKSIEHYLNKLK